VVVFDLEGNWKDEMIVIWLMDVFKGMKMSEDER
jgi:hypothetical protein